MYINITVVLWGIRKKMFWESPNSNAKKYFKALWLFFNNPITYLDFRARGNKVELNALLLKTDFATS